MELAIVLPLLLALLLGIVTGGITLSRDNSLNNAAREGARYGATLPVTTLDEWLADVTGVTIGSASGDLDDGVPGRSVCVAYVFPDGSPGTEDTTRSLTTSSDSSTVSATTPCFDDGRPDGERRVQVTVARETDFILVFFSTTLTLTGKSAVRYERSPT